ILPYMMGRIDHQTEVLGRARDNITQPVSIYMKDVYLDTVSPSRQALEYACEFSGADRLLFGSDHPWVSPQIFVKIIDEMKISELEKEKIYYQNAKSLFGIG
ncbi:MAG: amidohydrolase family protein, partial [Candidatus Poribacteria bacterium]|nr:amidohydrolase family protein [Candidatus Poribacteria bacterium]